MFVAYHQPFGYEQTLKDLLELPNKIKFILNHLLPFLWLGLRFVFEGISFVGKKKVSVKGCVNCYDNSYNMAHGRFIELELWKLKNLFFFSSNDKIPTFVFVFRMPPHSALRTLYTLTLTPYRKLNIVVWIGFIWCKNTQKDSDIIWNGYHRLILLHYNPCHGYYWCLWYAFISVNTKKKQSMWVFKTFKTIELLFER